MRARDRQRFVARHFYNGNVEDAYGGWPSPTTIVSDGAYGVGGFPGDPRTPEGLLEWYRPHVAAWSKWAKPATTLWFWNTEQGWAAVHPLLVEHGWEYVETIVWDKGIAHVAGNVNGDTIRQFPVVTEVCVFYRRKLTFPTMDGVMSAQKWLRYEWQRAGLALNLANAACGVKNAATRKYLTQDWLWYFPPPEQMVRLADYANKHGDPSGRPYFSIDGEKPVDRETWSGLRDVWRHQHGVTNVWREHDHDADVLTSDKRISVRDEVELAARRTGCTGAAEIADMLDVAFVEEVGGAANAVARLIDATSRSNVWVQPPLHGAERIRGSGRKVAPRTHGRGANASAHLNQKPLEFMRRILQSATGEGDIVWEPFGGLCSASVAAVELGREPFAAECVAEFFEIAIDRVDGVLLDRSGD